MPPVSQYIISSPTRVGSHYLLALLRCCNVRATKTHNPHLQTFYQRTTLILLRRKDLFATILSSAIFKRTKQPADYPDINLQAFTVNCNGDDSEFEQLYNYQKSYYLMHDFSRPWAQVEEFYFEDIVDNHNIVFDRLSITPKQDVNLPPQSPYKYQQYVSNVEECLKKFNELEAKEFIMPINDNNIIEEQKKESWGITPPWIKK